MSFTVCSMKRGPGVMLKSSGDLICYRFEQTATAVSLAAPAAAVFAKPADVKFAPLSPSVDPDSAAEGKPTEMTKEDKEQMKQACEMLKNFDLSSVLANAWGAMKKEMANAAVGAAKQSATNKLKGLIKKPKIP